MPPGSECPKGAYCNPASTLLECPAGTFGESFTIVLTVYFPYEKLSKTLL